MSLFETFFQNWVAEPLTPDSKEELAMLGWTGIAAYMALMAFSSKRIPNVIGFAALASIAGAYAANRFLF